jgi:hypothetical protein
VKLEKTRGERKMKNELTLSMLLILVLATVPIALRVEHVYASPSGPSLVVNDSINRVNATLGIKAGSKVTAYGVITNIGATTLNQLLTGVFFAEGTGVAVPGDFSFEFSLDCVTWFPIHPSEVKVAAPWTGYQVELVIGQAGGESLNPGSSSQMYLRMTVINDLTTVYGGALGLLQSMCVAVFKDANGNRHLDAGEPIYTQPPIYAGVINWDNPIRVDLAIVHTAEIEGTGKFYYNIQDAINAANPGATIIVYDGTYDEQVVIGKSLTLQGIGSTPIIKPSSAANLTTALAGYYWGGTKQIAGIIVANAGGASVTVKNLKVDGSSVTAKPAGADYVAGIFYRETGGTIESVVITDMTVGTTGTAVRGYGIYLSAIAYTVSVEIKFCTITNYDKNAIDVHGNKLTVNIHDNTLTGRGPLPNNDEVQNGVVIMDGATGTVDFNDISNMAYIPETWWSAGIMFLESDGSAEGNIITNCQMGVIFQDGSGSGQTNTVAGGTVGLLGLWAQYTTAGTWTATFVGNTVSGVRDSPGYENGAIGAQSWDAGSSLVVTILNNNLLGGGSTSADGIYIGDVPEYGPAGNIQAIITGNIISGWQNGIHLVSSVDVGTISNNNITGIYLGILVENAISTQICNNRIIDFVKGGIVTRGAKNIFIEGNIISTTLHDVAPNGIDIGTYTGTSGTVQGNEISGCSWNGFGGDYETSWSGSGILVIENGDSLEIIGNIVYDCDVGMDIESDSMNITGNEVYNNIYGFVFWNAKPKVNYNNIYGNTQYGVYRTAMGTLAGALDARYNWWGDATGPYHGTSWEYMGEPYGPHYGLGDNVNDYVLYVPWLLVIHDVAVIDVSASPTTVVAGETVTVNVTVKNEGSDYESFTVTVYYDYTAIASQNVINLFPNWTITLTFYWDTTGMPRGNYTIKAEASEVPGEIDLLDNVLVDGKVEVLWHDVAVVNVVCDRTWVYQGHSVNINVTVRNEGDYPETVSVTLYYNITADQEVGTQVINLLSGETQTIIFVWNTIGVEYCHNYTITAVASIAYPDVDPTDNTLVDGKVKVRILGDTDGDGKVDLTDILTAAIAFGSFPGHPAWNPLADINRDNKVDLSDFLDIAINFGKTCSP